MNHILPSVVPWDERREHTMKLLSLSLLIVILVRFVANAFLCVPPPGGRTTKKATLLIPHYQKGRRSSRRMSSTAYLLQARKNKEESVGSRSLFSPSVGENPEQLETMTPFWHVWMDWQKFALAFAPVGLFLMLGLFPYFAYLNEKIDLNPASQINRLQSYATHKLEQKW